MLLRRLAVFALSTACMAQPAALQQPVPKTFDHLSKTANLTSSARLDVSFTGKWVGQLEYRDFQTDAQTFLPTWLTMTPNAGGDSVVLDYIYDDGPTKTVRSRETLTLLATTATVADEKTSETYRLDGLDEFRKLGRGVLTLTGPGKENDKPVDVRITVTMRRNLFTWRKETRPAGTGEFKFRDAYTFTRSEPPAF